MYICMLFVSFVCEFQLILMHDNDIYRSFFIKHATQLIWAVIFTFNKRLSNHRRYKLLQYLRGHRGGSPTAVQA